MHMSDKTPQGYTHIEEAVEKWGRYRNWWYIEVREGRIIGYKLPGIKGTFLRDSDVETYINTPHPRTGDVS